MISHISIQNFAVIKELDIDLHPGLNMITGETGSGKSVVIEAVSMALGSRADRDLIRTGEDRAQVLMTVEDPSDRVKARMEEMGIPADDTLVLRREMSAQGRSLCRVNGVIVPLSQLSSLCSGIADIHGQYDHQYLLNTDSHIDVLDLYAGPSLQQKKAETAALYAEFVKASSELMQLRKHTSEVKKQQELLSYQLADIKAAAVKPGEDEELEASIALMQNSEQIFGSLSGVSEALYGSGDALGALGSAIALLSDVSSFSPQIRELKELLEDSYYRIEDIKPQLRRIRDSVNFSREELDRCLDRQEELNTLKRKYGGSLEAVLEYARSAEEDLALMEDQGERVKTLEKLITESRSRYDLAAEELSRLRAEAALRLSEAADRELAQLNFRDAHFEARIAKGPASENGTDTVEFMMTANKGEALKPLAKAASGGELSRVMLALKTILGDLDGIATMIFDEIDTGISGATAGIVGQKLKDISEGRQVICITHLPQIACLGDHHFKIRKSSDDTATYTSMEELGTEARIEELARLLSGTQITESARNQAKTLLFDQ